MSKFNGRFQSRHQSWSTPQTLWNALDREFHFRTDLAADATNTKCAQFYSTEDSAFDHEWRGVCWLNPPFNGRPSVKEWVRRCYEQAHKHGSVIVVLIQARTNNHWWHDYVMCASEVRLIRGRPRFGDCEYGVPTPLAVVVFDGNYIGPPRFSSIDAETGIGFVRKEV